MAEKSAFEGKSGSWARLGRELKKRTVDPFGHFSFVGYFLVAVVIFGGAGIWIELRSYIFFVASDSVSYPSLASLRTAVATFFFALAGSSCMQLILAEDRERFLRAFAMVLLALLTMLIIFFVTPIGVTDLAALAVGTGACVVALWLWWIANAKQKDLLDPDAPTGGYVTSGVLPGNLDGFKV